MLNRISKLSFLFVLAIALAFVSCEKEALDGLSDDLVTSNAEVRTEEGAEAAAAFETVNARGERGNSGGNCFELVYPLTIAFPDGSTAEVASREAAKEAKQAWKEANPDAEGSSTLVFPIQIVQDSATVDIADAEALAAVKAECPRNGRGGNNGRRGNNGRDGSSKCYQAIYPLTISFPDGTSQEVADKDAAKEAKMAWKEANPDAEGRPSIAFPYDVMLADSTTMTLTSQEELDALKDTCSSDRGDRGNGGDRGNRGGGRGDRDGDRGNACFDVNYPVNITIDGGEAITIEERSDIRAALSTWKEANPEATERPDISIVFPITVTLEDGTEMMVASQEDLDALRDSCSQEEDGQ